MAFFLQTWFPFVPSFNCAIIFRSFHLDFLCANLATPIISSCLFVNIRCARLVILPRHCSPAPSPNGFNCPIIFQSSSISHLYTPGWTRTRVRTRRKTVTRQPETLRCHPTQGPYRRCQKRSALFHVLESLWVSLGTFPWLQRNLSVFLGSVFSFVSNMYIWCNGILPLIFSHSNAAAPIIFSTVVWLQILSWVTWGRTLARSSSHKFPWLLSFQQPNSESRRPTVANSGWRQGGAGWAALGPAYGPAGAQRPSSVRASVLWSAESELWPGIITASTTRTRPDRCLIRLRRLRARAWVARQPTWNYFPTPSLSLPVHGLSVCRRVGFHNTTPRLPRLLTWKLCPRRLAVG